MSEQLALLRQVQDADLEIARLKQEQADLDTGESLRAEISRLQQELEALRARVEALDAEHTDRTLELESITEKRKRFESQLYGGRVSNPRQLSDLQEEVAMLKREGDQVETRVIELMLELEEQQQAVADKEGMLAEARARLEETEKGFRETSARLESEIALWEERRKSFAERVDGPLLKRYERIRASKGDTGLAVVSGATCSACRVTLPSQRLKAIKAGRVGETCDNCGRLLMWEEEGGGEAADDSEEEDLHEGSQ